MRAPPSATSNAAMHTLLAGCPQISTPHLADEPSESQLIVHKSNVILTQAIRALQRPSIDLSAVNLDDLRKLSIDNALTRYQATVKEHNLSILHVILDSITSTQPGLSDQAATTIHLAVLRRFLRWPQTELITEPQQILSVNLQLDGICHKPITPRKAWFEAIADELDVEFPPPDLEYLCSLTNYIHGPGLDWWQITRQIDLLSEALETPESRVVIPARGLEADCQLEGLWDTEITIGVRIGDKESGTGGSYALYCQKNDTWAWRYAVVDDECPSEVFNSLEEYLDFYSHFSEPTEDEARTLAQLWGSKR